MDLPKGSKKGAHRIKSVRSEEMTFEENSFDLILDKSTMDTFACSEADRLVQHSSQATELEPKVWFIHVVRRFGLHMEVGL